MGNSTTRRGTSKANKFPLFQHKTGRWCKKVRGKFCYFGKVADDPTGQAALDRWLDERDDLLAGRPPRAKAGDAATIKTVCNEFLEFKEDLLKTGELAQRSYDCYFGTCERLIDLLGARRAVIDLGPADFKELRRNLSKGRGPVWLKNEIGRVNSVFRYAYKSELIERPVRFGPSFEKPSAKVLRANRQKNGPRMFKRVEVTAVLKLATVNAKAMVLLALNCGFGNTDLALLPISAIDTKASVLDFPRSKTAIERVIPLWPETVAAIQDVLANRGEPNNPDSAALLFIGRRGEDYIGDHKGTRVHQELRRILKLAKVEGRSFYDLRRTFQTVAEGSRDLPAVQAVMGHAASSGDMSAIYRQTVTMERKLAAVNVVRDWLYPADEKQEGGKDE